MSALHQTIRAEPRRCPPPVAPVRRTTDRLPPGTCDVHCHVFGPTSVYPLDPGRGYTPSIMTISDYRAVMEGYGIERAVLVQPSVYGFDNSALLDALTVMPGSLRGVAVIRPDEPNVAFRRAHRRGVRGIRINPRNPAGLSLVDVSRFADRIGLLGWHIQLQISVEEITDLARLLGDARVPVVIDHFGFPDLARGPEGRGFGALVDLAAAGRCWVKMSAPYRVAGAARNYDVLAPYVERLVEKAPAALLWALDWPHTECFEAVPDDASILDLVWNWLPTPELRQMVLCANPMGLYWADEPSGAPLNFAESSW